MNWRSPDHDAKLQKLMDDMDKSRQVRDRANWKMAHAKLGTVHDDEIAAACYEVSNMYRFGSAMKEVGEKSNTKRWEWICKAAKLGHEEALRDSIRHYQTTDPKIALMYVAMAQEKYSNCSDFDFLKTMIEKHINQTPEEIKREQEKGRLQLYQRMINDEMTQIRMWYQNIAQEGEDDDIPGRPEVLFKMYMMYNKGWHVERNEETAQGYLLRSARAGWPEAIKDVFHGMIHKHKLDEVMLLCRKGLLLHPDNSTIKGIIAVIEVLQQNERKAQGFCVR
jgi:TPR repeat protein